MHFVRPIYFLFAPLAVCALSYEVSILGIDNQDAIRSMLDVSDLVTLQEKPVNSRSALRYRAASDVSEFIEVLHAYGYYDATIRYEIETPETGPAQVYLYVSPGEQYLLSSYTVLPKLSRCSLDSIETGVPALSESIVNDELQVLSDLSRCGYPLAKVQKRTIEVDMLEKEVNATLELDEGPLSRFGPTAISGLSRTQERFVRGKLQWEEGAIYNEGCIEETQKKLLNTNLFSSVYITHDETLNPYGELPLHIKFEEALSKQFSFGAFYATVDGPGGQFSWANNNVFGLGRRLEAYGEFSTRYFAGKLAYKIPDFLNQDQTYKALGEVERQKYRPYTAFIYRLANYLERKMTPKSYLTLGLEFERFKVSDSATDGTYWMSDLPIMARYYNADDLVNPTRGYMMTYQASPYQSLTDAHVHFIKQVLTTSFYLPWLNSKLVWAARVQVGSIAGANQEDIPLPVLFLGGSEDDLRGYRYYTVSPLNAENQPLGGRSAIYVSAEARLRLTETIGIVPFADFGTVALSELPTVDTKWYKSLGAGLRYFTFFGPIRVDVGFPLDKRKGIDAPYRVYVSVGQAF